MCPRTCLPFGVAQLKTRSPSVKLNWFWSRSVASIFISFSAVTESNSLFAMVVYADSLSLLAAIAAPKYRPDCAVASPSVVAVMEASTGVVPFVGRLQLASTEPERARSEHSAPHRVHWHR